VYQPQFIDGADQEIHFFQDEVTGASGVIAIHSYAIGPAAGGCLYDCQDSSEQVADAMRLARGMSCKNALAGLPFGGGKAVLQRPQCTFDRRRLFEAFGDAVAKLNGTYVTAEDVGTTVADMHVVRTRTRYVAGLEAASDAAGGDPSLWTALGVFESMKAAADLVFGAGLAGLTVAVQGARSVGAGLCRLLAGEGARLIIADLNMARTRALAAEVSAQVVGAEEILAADAQIFAPCASGGVLNAESIQGLKAKLICGAANNQLATAADGEALLERGIVYAPDYVVNAGGIISVAAEYLGEPLQQVEERVRGIPTRLLSVLDSASLGGRCPGQVANELAQDVIASTGRKAA
jgi:leucine dehydrogenase